MKLLLISLSGFLLPGLGHLLQGRRGKGLTFLVVLGLVFLFGVSLDPDYYQKFGPSLIGPPTFSIEDLPRVPGESDAAEGFVDKASRVLFTWVFPFCVGFFTFVVGHVIQPLLWGLYRWAGWVGSPAEAAVALKDVGYCFAQLSGLLNLLTMMDAYDIGYNRSLYQKRWPDD